MAKVYQKCGSDVQKIVKDIIAEHHPVLAHAEVRVDCVFCESDGGPAVALAGYPCLAVIKRTSLKQRVQGHGDAEITIDKEWWGNATEEQQAALIDHELTHLQVKNVDGGIIEPKSLTAKSCPDTDDIGRPKLKLRLHDWQIGGFAEVAKRHGDNALEVAQAMQFHEKHGQMLMQFASHG